MSVKIKPDILDKKNPKKKEFTQEEIIEIMMSQSNNLTPYINEDTIQKIKNKLSLIYRNS